MSIAEIFDHGAPHPWANLRINNLTVDGTFIAPTFAFVGTIAATFNGAIPATVFSIDFVKVGSLVSLTFRDIISIAGGGAPGAISALPGTLPANLMPFFGSGINSLNYPCRVIDNGAVTNDAGLLSINTTGLISISLDISGTGFGVVGQRGMFGITISYRSAI